jgi:peptide-methionine (R)-S-oxide reductase
MSTPPATPKLVKTEDEWRQILDRAQFDVLRKHGTERPGSSPLDHEFRPGRYACAGCGAILFVSDQKFDSGCGWPSFSSAQDGTTETSRDSSHFMIRTEVHCANCGGHLGHIFDDGPAPTGLRYCINGVALKFDPSK